jgi:thioredoxin-related protein
MKRIIFLLLVLTCFLHSNAQEPGINFQSNLSWATIKAKAKTDDKFIFVDCYATWCVPCKEMDKKVYAVDSIGDYMNANFISVKCQFDSSKSDSKEIQAWYADAQSMMVEYKINQFPTFLFFTPDAKLIGRDIGLKDAGLFKEMAADIIKARKYFALLSAYKKGQLAVANFPDFVTLAERFNEKIPDSVIEKYFSWDIVGLPEGKIFTRENLLFAGRHLQSLRSGQILFKLIRNNLAETDKLAFPGYANQAICYVIRKEEIWDKLWADFSKAVPYTKKPDWNDIKLSIAKKYNQQYSDSLVLPEQFDFYELTGNSTEFARLSDSVIRKYPPTNTSRKLSLLFGYRSMGINRGSVDDIGALNELAWEVFLFCKNKKVLKRAIGWSELSIRLQGDSGLVFSYMDTKANLLYKANKKREAINLEEQVLNMAAINTDAGGRKFDPGFVKSYKKTLEKMKKGEPTW